MQTIDGPEALRDRALKRIQKRRDFSAHLAVYVLVNGFLIAIWAMTSAGGFFWPMFPIFGWGIGLVMHAWDVFLTPEITEADIDREVDRIKQS
jgi:hypothetical protein